MKSLLKLRLVCRAYKNYIGIIKNMDSLIDKSKHLLSIVWGDRKVRQAIEDTGVKVVPNNFYSNIPSIQEIENSYEYTDIEKSVPPYGECNIFSEPETTRQLLEELVVYSSEFVPQNDDDEDAPEGFFWNNTQFSYSDAMSYYAFIRHFKPKKIVEIGSGFSTLIAIDAIQKNGSGDITCIEPFPRPFIEKSDKIDLLKVSAQNITSKWLNENLNDGDVLFIDSTHTVKTGSDCLHIYLRLLPEIKHDIYVHVHDVFLPFGMPIDWLLDHHIYWTEQYLLLAFLLDNHKASFLFGSSYHEWANEDLLKSFMHGRASPGGGSFWFKYCGAAKPV